MTLPRKVFQVKKGRCPACGDHFKETLKKAGRPAIYCRRCRKDAKVYPGAIRRQRERVKRDGWDAEKARRVAIAEIRERVLGSPDAGEES